LVGLEIGYEVVEQMRVENRTSQIYIDLVFFFIFFISKYEEITFATVLLCSRMQSNFLPINHKEDIRQSYLNIQTTSNSDPLVASF